MTVNDPIEMLVLLAHRSGGWGNLAAEFGWTASYMSAIKVGRKPIPDKLLARMGLRRVVEVRYEDLYTSDKPA
jgi:hypothetical protein